MSIWVELINQVLQLQADVVTCAQQAGSGVDVGGCPTTAFNPIAAAFATQGYFMQADMLYYITGTTFGTWAPFLYLIAAASGIISLAMGAPPKMYLWFFVGPGVYHWLVETRLPVHGVQWQVGNVPQDQRAVWRMAHVGIKNNNLVARMAGQVPGTSADTEYELKTNVAQATDADGWCKPTADPVYVSNFFLQFDMLTSYAVERLVSLTGVNRVSNVKDSGSLDLPTTTSTDPNRWYLLADKKWALLDTITSARLSSSNLRDAFVTFLSSECGDALSSTVDQASFVQASNSSTGNTPCTVMLHEDFSPLRAGATCTAASTDFYDDKYKLVWNTLRTKGVPIPETLRRLFQDDGEGSFIYFLNAKSGTDGEKLAGFYRSHDYAECHQNFFTIMQGFRWEASQIYSQLVRSGPPGFNSKEYLLYNLFYGWGARKEIGGDLIPADEMKQWTRDLIFVHLIRNELAIAPRLADKKFTNQATLDSYSQNFTANTGAKTKYGEIYSWARMVPYMQGIMLYLLAMGYPFACMMMVMPGWHKTLFTWASFWVWVKLWDAGFAVVTTIERSIWSMLGNSTKLNYTSPLVYKMKDWGMAKADETCPSGDVFASAYCFADMKLSLSCSVGDAFYDANTGGTPWWHTAALFDRALTLASNIDLDVANGYYIYLMSALYFAVPAATGQLVLGAKAGVSGMVNGLVQGVQQDGGRGSSSGFTGDMKNKGAQVAAAVGQSAVAKSHRATGLAASAIQAGNQGLESQLLGAQYGTANQNLSLQGANRGLTAQTASGYSSAAGQVAGLVAARGSNIGGIMTEALLGGSSNRPMTDPRSFQDALLGQDGSGAAPETGGANPQRETTGSGAETTGVNLRNAAQKGWGLGMQGSSGLYTLQSAMQGAANGAYQADLGAVMNNAQAGYNAAQAQNNVASFGQTSLQQGLGMAGQRASQAAEFSAQAAAYQARVGLADSATGYTASMGVDSSHLGVGQKPTDMNGMAYSGMLGSGAKSAYGYASSGFMTARAGAMSQLAPTAAQVANEYQGSQYSLGQSMTAADNKFKDLNDSIGGDWLNIGSNINRLPPNPTQK